MSASEKKSCARENLLIAAEKLFAERGYAAVSTRELAEAAKVNLGAIQYHFGSKAELFIETVRRLMQSRYEKNPLVALGDKTSLTRFQAAAELCSFVRTYLHDICQPTGPDVCRLMHREALSQTNEQPELFEALVSSVVEEFIRPGDAELQELLRALCPEKSDEDLALIVHSILGQCTFYVTHRPFIERLRRCDYSSTAAIDRAAEHITRFTLRGIGFSDQDLTELFQKY